MAAPTDPLYAQQWHFGLMGNIARVWDEYTGRGVSVAVYDDGLQYDHPDLAANYDASKHFTYQGEVYDPMPLGEDDSHGTACAGIIGSVANNKVGGSGVAPGVKLTGVNFIVDLQEAEQPVVEAALRWANRFDIMSNSWGSDPNYEPDQSLAVDPSISSQAMTNANMKYVVETGRGGLGTVIVQASGNETMNANGDGVNASRYTLSIAATEKDGFAADYSNFGASILVAAPASAVTTDLTGEAGSNKSGDADPLPTDYTGEFNGTSAATPTVAGVVALMLEANRGLGWRDVASVLAQSARHTGSAYDADPSSTEQGPWTTLSEAGWNGGGHAFHFSYGFGMVDAFAAVRMAEVWTTLRGAASTSANETTVSASYTGPTVAIPDATASRDGERALSFRVTRDVEIETAYVTVDLSHRRGSDLTLSIVLPDGTEIPLLENEDIVTTQTQAGLRWTFGVEALRGISSVGTWQVLVRDSVTGQTGSVRSAKLEFFGTANSANDIHTYTGDFLALRDLQPDRGTLVDANGGTDWINMAAIAGNISANLSAGGTVRVGTANWFTLSAGAATIENFAAGDGNDTITGNSLANRLLGMRGNDTLLGGGGNDTLDGGTGADTLRGEGGNDTYVVDNAGDRVFEASNQGTDTVNASVSFSLAGQAIENLVLTGTAAINGTGNSAANSITGNAAANLIDGGTGADTMAGKGGNDTYVVDNAGDKVIEASNQGTDTVNASVSFSLAGQAIENLVLTGTAAINGTGNSAANSITGNDAANTIDGGAGADRMAGRGGNDTYIVDNAGDRVTEASNQGTDTVNASVGFSLAGQAIENLVLTGTAAINGTGNSAVNAITGNGAANILDGALGSDILTGGAGADTFLFASTPAANNIDRITDFSVPDDTIRLDRSVFAASLALGTLTANLFKDLGVAGAVLDTDDRVVYNSKTGVLSFDANGSLAGGATQFALLDNKALLTAADFFVVA
ncbi:S8 family serine peptidase [Ensifer soli]|uniref:S8 family serine peptidase n=1 Tax=Ciceribacter sp. sgz301302 TaxID=3342379 RepID=UPI0035B98955